MIVSWFIFTTLFVVGAIAGGIPIAATLSAIATLVGLAWFLKRRIHPGVLGDDDELVILNFFCEQRIPGQTSPASASRRPTLSESLRTNSARGPLVQLVRRDATVMGLNVTATTPMNSQSPPTDERLRVLSDW